MVFNRRTRLIIFGLLVLALATACGANDDDSPNDATEELVDTEVLPDEETAEDKGEPNVDLPPPELGVADLEETVFVSTSPLRLDFTSLSAAGIVLVSSTPEICAVNDSNEIELLRGGTCELTAAQESTEEWASALLEVTFTVAEPTDPKLMVVGDLAAVDLVAGGDPFQLEIASLSEAPEEFVSEDLSVCEVTETGLIKPVGAGDCVVTISVEATDAHVAAEIEEVLSVAAVSDGAEENPVVIATLPTEVQVGHEGERVSASSDSGLPLTFRASGACTVDAEGNLTFTSGGLCVVTASTNGNSQWKPGRGEAEITVSRLDPQLVVGEVPEVVTVGDNFRVPTSAESDAPLVIRTSGACTNNGPDVTAEAAGRCRITVTVEQTPRYDADTASRSSKVEADAVEEEEEEEAEEEEEDQKPPQEIEVTFVRLADGDVGTQNTIRRRSTGQLVSVELSEPSGFEVENLSVPNNSLDVLRIDFSPTPNSDDSCQRESASYFRQIMGRGQVCVITLLAPETSDFAETEYTIRVEPVPSVSLSWVVESSPTNNQCVQPGQPLDPLTIRRGTGQWDDADVNVTYEALVEDEVIDNGTTLTFRLSVPSTAAIGDSFDIDVSHRTNGPWYVNTPPPAKVTVVVGAACNAEKPKQTLSIEFSSDWGDPRRDEFSADATVKIIGWAYFAAADMAAVSVQTGSAVPQPTVVAGDCIVSGESWLFQGPSCTLRFLLQPTDEYDSTEIDITFVHEPKDPIRLFETPQHGCLAPGDELGPIDIHMSSGEQARLIAHYSDFTQMSREVLDDGERVRYMLSVPEVVAEGDFGLWTITFTYEAWGTFEYVGRDETVAYTVSASCE